MQRRCVLWEALGTVAGVSVFFLLDPPDCDVCAEGRRQRAGSNEGSTCTRPTTAVPLMAWNGLPGCQGALYCIARLAQQGVAPSLPGCSRAASKAAHGRLGSARAILRHPARPLPACAGWVVHCGGSGAGAAGGGGSCAAPALAGGGGSGSALIKAPPQAQAAQYCLSHHIERGCLPRLHPGLQCSKVQWQHSAAGQGERRAERRERAKLLKG